MTFYHFKKYVNSKFKGKQIIFDSNTIQHTAWINALDITVYGSSIHNEIQEYRPMEKQNFIKYTVV